jgi:mono/diheme cytochrome c family protein
MTRSPLCALALCCAPWLVSCTPEPPVVPVAAASVAAPVAAAPSGEHLVYIVGCVNCHHQTPKQIINAPPLVLAKGYSPAEFTTLLRTGIARDGRDLYAQGSLMGIVAREQLSHLSDAEIGAIHAFLRNDWTTARAAVEEAKIATFPPPTFHKN